MRSFETDRGKRLLILFVALVVIAFVVAVVASGFRGRHVTQSAKALTAPEVSPKAGSPAPHAPAPP